MPTPISRHWTLEDALRTSHAEIQNQIEQVLRYGRIHSKDQIRKDLERTARTVLDPLCDKFGKGTVSSGYRSPALNYAVGGSPNSAHTVGLAFDWEPPGAISPVMLWALDQDDLPFDRLIVEQRGKSLWLHVQAAEYDAKPARALFRSPSSGLFTRLTHDQVLALNV